MGCDVSTPVETNYNHNHSRPTSPNNNNNNHSRPNQQYHAAPNPAYGRQQQQRKKDAVTAAPGTNKKKTTDAAKFSKVPPAKRRELESRVKQQQQQLQKGGRSGVDRAVVQRRLSEQKRSPQIQQRQQTLVQERLQDAKNKSPDQVLSSSARTKFEQAKKDKIPPPPTSTQLKRDLAEYNRPSPFATDVSNNNKDAAATAATAAAGAAAGASEVQAQAHQQTPEQFLQQAEELIPAEVIMLSGCEVEQTSADVGNISGSGLPDPKGRAGGAATSALLSLLYEHKGEHFTFQDALMALRGRLSEQGHSQIPQLSSSRPLDIEATPFSLASGGDIDNNNSGTLTGNKRALLVGINYIGQNGELRGCHNDAYHMKDYLVNVQGFDESNIIMLTDDGSGVNPTKQQMISKLKELVERSDAGDSVFFHYSGHGGFLEPDQNSLKEKNNEYDTTLIPLDHQESGQIRDFNLFNHFVKPLKKGVKAVCLIDACHSGSVLELPYTFKPTEEGKGVYRQEMNVGAMVGNVFLAILAGWALSRSVIDPIFGLLDEIFLGEPWMDTYSGFYAAELANDLIIEELLEEAILEEILEQEITAEVERRIEAEIEEEIMNEVIEEAINKAIEEELEREVERMVEDEIARELEREAERIIQEEIARELEREAERMIEDELANAFFDDF